MRIGNRELCVISRVLHYNSTLKTLDLWNNHIGDQGLAQALLHNSTLQDINLGNNQIGDQGAKAISQSLLHNSALKELNLWYNQIGDKGVQVLAQALDHNSTIQRLYLRGNPGVNTGLFVRKYVADRRIKLVDRINKKTRENSELHLKELEVGLRKRLRKIKYAGRTK